MKHLVFVLAIAGLGVSAMAQQVNRCGYDHIIQQASQQNPEYLKSIERAFDIAKRDAAMHKQNASNKQGAAPNPIYRIPIVVHIVYADPGQNIEDSLVSNQIEVLNQDYRRVNRDTVNTRVEFNGLGADAGIEFYLATTDPNGQPTTGITRTSTSAGSFGLNFDDLKSDASGGKDPWPTDRYLNIWVGDLSFFGFPAILGAAYPPVSACNWPEGATPSDSSLQGVVAHYEVFGRNNPRAVSPLDIADAGRTITHEVGHYLGLRHIWGDGGGGFIPTVDCSVDDGIEDTPNSGNNSQGTGGIGGGGVACDPLKNTCDDGIGDLPDMWENYMDYSEERCQNIFTHGQVEVMRGILRTVRNSLVGGPKGCVPDTFGLLAGDTLFLKGGDLLITKAGDSLSVDSSTTAALYTEAIDTIGGVQVVVDPGDALLVCNCHITLANLNLASGIADHNADFDFSVYPNPNQGIFTIQLRDQNEVDRVMVTDMLGKVVRQIEIADNTTSLILDLTGVSKGMYYLQLHSGKSFATQKVIIE